MRYNIRYFYKKLIMTERKLDQFFTTPKIANECLMFLNENIDINNIYWIEPSAGSGVFLKEAKKLNYPECLYSCDLMPRYAHTQQKDFLNLDISFLRKNKKQFLCLGNPPFGKNSSLAVKFFNHAAIYVDIIAMILPATFAKESLQKRLNKNFHLMKQLVLGLTEFVLIKKKKKIPVIFQIWVKKEVQREIKKQIFTSEYFSFVNKESADLAIQRIGYSAGKIKKEIKDLAISSHYFIKLFHKKHIDIFQKIDWTNIKNKTAGNPSISKPELITEFKKQLKLTL